MNALLSGFAERGEKVENSFDRGVNQIGENLVSAKKDGGFGISSIISVISRHNGEYTPVWEKIHSRNL